MALDASPPDAEMNSSGGDFGEKPKMKNTNEERLSLLTINEVLEILRVCRRTLEREINRGRFPRPIKVGKCLRWPPADLQAYFDHQNRERGVAPSAQ